MIQQTLPLVEVEVEGHFEVLYANSGKSNISVHICCERASDGLPIAFTTNPALIVTETLSGDPLDVELA